MKSQLKIILSALLIIIAYIIGVNDGAKEQGLSDVNDIRNLTETTIETSLRLKNGYYEVKCIEIDGTYVNKVDKIIKGQILDTFDKNMYNEKDKVFK